MRSIESVKQGVWVAEVPPNRASGRIYPHATLCVWLSEMAKSFWRYYDINNLTQDYREEKEESKETMALEL